MSERERDRDLRRAMPDPDISEHSRVSAALAKEAGQAQSDLLAASTPFDHVRPRSSEKQPDGLAVPGRDDLDKGESFEAPRLSTDSDPDAPTLRPPQQPWVQHERPNASRAGTSTSVRTTGSRTLPPLKREETRLAQKQAHPWQHLGITLGLPMIVLFDIVIPCIIYYTWYNNQKSGWEETCRSQYAGRHPCPIQRPQFDKDILGSAIACFGFGELWILIARVWRLYFRREECAPLLNRRSWELDATSWVYAVSMIVALVPFVVGSSLVIPKLYLYGPSFLMGFLGVLMFITTCMPFNIPVGINSHARGSGLRPFIYYAAEDFIAVDGLQDREFRVRYNERYESNPMFRRFFLYLTLWWMAGVCVYIGCVSAVIWLLPFHYAFGLSLGVLFAYIATWAAVSFFWVKWEMRREHAIFEQEQEQEEA